MKDIKQELLEAPRALREMLEKGRPEYEAVVRQARWGEGPLWVLASGAEQSLGLTARYAFESLLGWPVVEREATEFAAYSSSLLQPRSALLVIAGPEESTAILDVARQAKARGAGVMVLTSDPQSPLAQMAGGTFLVRAVGRASMVCRQAALCYVALIAAQVLKRHHPHLAALEEDFAKLPAHLEWVLTQLGDAVRAFAAELRGGRDLHAVGGGFYYPVALGWARLLQTGASHPARAFAPGDPAAVFLAKPHAESALVLISGSRCRVKKAVHELAAEGKKAGARILAVTDRNDRELSTRASLTILLPELSEMVGATLAFALLEWVAWSMRREAEASAKRATKSLPGGPDSADARPRRT